MPNCNKIQLNKFVFTLFKVYSRDRHKPKKKKIQQNQPLFSSLSLPTTNPINSNFQPPSSFSLNLSSPTLSLNNDTPLFLFLSLST
ncbi:hypothetical protein Hanom_Chr00s000003g01602421 [Helianthus anomalus]